MTVLVYIYRDAANYKAQGLVFVDGKLDLDDLRPYLHDDGFIPGDVGLPELQSQLQGFPGSDDHVWHELSCVYDSPETREGMIPAGELVARFKAAAERGWKVGEACERLGLQSCR